MHYWHHTAQCHRLPIHRMTLLHSTLSGSYLLSPYQDKPSFDEVAAMILRHTKMQIEYKGEYLGIREMRKHVGWYTAGYKNSSSIRRQVNEVENYEQLERLINDCRNL